MQILGGKVEGKLLGIDPIKLLKTDTFNTVIYFLY
jgi:hypothetical protein